MRLRPGLRPEPRWERKGKETKEGREGRGREMKGGERKGRNNPTN